ncbi:MAG: hypothetical protein E6Q97_32850 [Desulfurellales bacterium]|nr:MAG: hypothetical protein E6Q97_32850 [Desulfurellales bacterium]
MNWLRDVYDKAAVVPLFDMFSDDAVDVVYTMRDASPVTLKAIIRNRVVEMDGDDSFGDKTKVVSLDVVISTDASGPWGGVADPQLLATWEVDGVQYNADPRPGKGVQVLSDSLALVSLRRSTAVNKAFPNYRRD